MVQRPRPRHQLERVFEALPGTTNEISKNANVDLRCVCRHLRALEAEGRAHISEYPDGMLRRGVVWSKGPRPDDMPPRPEKTLHKYLRQRDIDRSGRAPKNTPENYRNTYAEDRTIERAREQPANWFRALESA